MLQAHYHETMRRHRHQLPPQVTSDEDSDDDDSDDSDDDPTMKCVSCKEEYTRCDAGTCRECYEEASETEEELKREIDELKSKVSFLRFWAPLNQLNNRFATPCFTDVVLMASGDGSGEAVPVPAHKAVLVCGLFLILHFICSQMSFL